MGYLWAECGSACGNQSGVLTIDNDAASPTFRKFKVLRQLAAPTTMPNLKNEGIAVAPESQCSGGQKPFFWTDDGETNGHAIRADSIPCGRFIDDPDHDGVLDPNDNCPSVANADQANTDGDVQGNACDACPNDATNDIDGDGVCGLADNCPAIANGAQTDGDGDGQGDVCDICPLDASNDADGDGLCADADNCAGVANGSQADSDGDGFGDACDVCPLDPVNDADGDGLCADADNCPSVANSNQSDLDGDSLGDACDPDDDGDGVQDDADNCPATYNPDQADFDGNGGGDACDTDDDDDGVPDTNDACPATAPGSVVNSNGCSVADLAPCDSAWKNHGAYVRAIAHTVDQFVSAGLLTNAQGDAMKSAAAGSSCGN